MDNSESDAPQPAQQDEAPEHGEAQRAADGLKDQIAALRARVKDAQARLREGEPREDERRDREPRSFRR